MTLSALTTPEFWNTLIEQVVRKLSGEQGVTLLLIWCTVALAATVTYLRVTPEARSFRGFVRHVFPREIFQHPSPRADFLFWLSRRIFMPLLVAPLVISTVTAGHAMYWLLTQIFGAPTHPPGQAGPLMLLAFTVTMLLAYDLAYYLYHLGQHKIPLLWELHKVHHSAQTMVGVTKDRVHPLDEILNRWWNGLIPGCTYGAWLFFALDPVEVTVFGISAYTLRSLLMMDVVRHTHLEMSYGRWLNRVFLCPYHHQLHHSIEPRHYNKNFGLLLSVWDELFGTFAVPEPNQHFTFGLSDNEHAEYQSLARLHYVPLVKMGRLTRDWLHRKLGQPGNRLPGNAPPLTSRSVAGGRQ
jgi:sterol desaturase/sphingolipid hydroxylase (fatty acid hydroxylase superfamily)